MSKFTRIGIVGRPDHKGVLETLNRLMAYLADKPVSIALDHMTSGLLSGPEVETCGRRELASRCDLVIVVGGDGSMLTMAKHIASDQVPVIGVNRGKLGFLTDILPEELEVKIDQVLAGDYSVESRFLLDAARIKDGKKEKLGTALNDIVLHPGQAAQMIEFELFVNDRFVYSQASDGLIVATPTGSTAYALSAGGPIMHPNLNAMVLVPMYPHSLNSRPIVVDGDSEIRIVVAANGKLQPQISCDGEEKYIAHAGDEIVVTKKDISLKLIHPPQYSFYEACRSKLGWGSRLGKVVDQGDD
ncbi:MAG: NAD(+) kinase [Pseudohongiellaceae bacterium]